MAEFLNYEDALDGLLKPFPESWRDTFDEDWIARQFDTDDRVCWQSLDADGNEVLDHGIVKGFGIRPAEHLGRWHWNYLIELDEDSPSAGRTEYVLLWQDDLSSDAVLWQ